MAEGVSCAIYRIKAMLTSLTDTKENTMRLPDDEVANLDYCDDPLNPLSTW